MIVGRSADSADIAADGRGFASPVRGRVDGAEPVSVDAVRDDDGRLAQAVTVALPNPSARGLRGDRDEIGRVQDESLERPARPFQDAVAVEVAQRDRRVDPEVPDVDDQPLPTRRGHDPRSPRKDRG
jgi:hypothetical protein